MNVIEIVKRALIDSGHDGLYNADCECACLIDDLRPCSSDFAECIPGYKHDSDNPDYEFYVRNYKQDGEMIWPNACG